MKTVLVAVMVMVGLLIGAAVEESKAAKALNEVAAVEVTEMKQLVRAMNVPEGDMIVTFPSVKDRTVDIDVVVSHYVEVEVNGFVSYRDLVSKHNGYSESHLLTNPFEKSIEQLNQKHITEGVVYIPVFNEDTDLSVVFFRAMLGAVLEVSSQD